LLQAFTLALVAVPLVALPASLPSTMFFFRRHCRSVGSCRTVDLLRYCCSYSLVLCCDGGLYWISGFGTLSVLAFYRVFLPCRAVGLATDLGALAMLLFSCCDDAVHWILSSGALNALADSDTPGVDATCRRLCCWAYSPVLLSPSMLEFDAPIVACFGLSHLR
jgi:hypothetical protein